MNEESLFAAALERSTTTERRAFLDEACGGDLALREQGERLLAAHDQTRGVLDQAALGPGMEAVTAGFSPSGVPPAERAGTLVAGRYKLIDEIGEGGMGSVWMAEQLQPLRRKVAIKFIRAGMD